MNFLNTKWIEDGDHGHVWKKDDDGNIDNFALDADYHNGPECVKCGFSLCEHCVEDLENCSVSDEEFERMRGKK